MQGVQKISLAYLVHDWKHADRCQDHQQSHPDCGVLAEVAAKASSSEVTCRVEKDACHARERDGQVYHHVDQESEPDTRCSQHLGHSQLGALVIYLLLIDLSHLFFY